MKKIYTLFILVCIILLSGCLAKPVDHPIRDVPTETEFQELVETLKESTVSLYGHYMTFELSLGSGLIYDKLPSNHAGYFYYYVLTNNHVVEYMTHVQVKTYKGPVEIGDIYGFPLDQSDRDDLAIVRFESNFDYPVIDIVTLNEDRITQLQLAVGQYVFGIGTPVSKDNFNLVSNLGVISDLSGGYISHTANINPGNSGGPLFSYDGTFIGVNTQRVEIIDGETIYLVGDAIHANVVAEVVKRRLESVGPKLGVIIVNYDEFTTTNYEEGFGEVAEDFDPYDYVPRSKQGVVIIEVNATRPSHGILKRFDLIQKVNGIQILNNEDLMLTLGQIEYGKTYTFDVLRFNASLNQFENLLLEVTIS